MKSRIGVYRLPEITIRAKNAWKILIKISIEHKWDSFLASVPKSHWGITTTSFEKTRKDVREEANPQRVFRNNRIGGKCPAKFW